MKEIPRLGIYNNKKNPDWWLIRLNTPNFIAIGVGHCLGYNHVSKTMWVRLIVSVRIPGQKVQLNEGIKRKEGPRKGLRILHLWPEFSIICTRNAYLSRPVSAISALTLQPSTTRWEYKGHQVDTLTQITPLPTYPPRNLRRNEPHPNWRDPQGPSHHQNVWIALITL